MQKRGVQDIRTMAGRVGHGGQRHKAYLRLCTLEMERVRREQEYTSASARAKTARARMDMLDSEISALLSQFGGVDRPQIEVCAKPGFIDRGESHVEFRY